jgi:RNA polymerase sigma factor (sigma-70 family)
MMTQDIFERCQRNEGKAQRAVYDLYKAKLMGLCRRFARDREDARDILQESFIKIFSKIRQVESADKLEAWMKSIAVRTAIDHYHKLKRIDHQSYSKTDFNIPDSENEIILGNLTDEYLIRIINELPEGCRLVFNLFEVEGYSHQEIADLLGIGEGTSRSQLHHAKYLLKQKLNSIGIKRYEKFA